MTNLALVIVDPSGGAPLRHPSIEVPLDSDGIDVTERPDRRAVAVVAVTVAARLQTLTE